MDDKTELTISINQANNLKQIIKMPGWKIPEKFIKESEEECNKKLKDKDNKDLADIQACRLLLEWIDRFRKLIYYTEISAYEDEQELERIKNERRD